MIDNSRICVSIPAYKEERFIAQVLETLPDFVDEIVVVDDGSPDRTGEIVSEKALGDPRIHLVSHSSNMGLGQTLIDGYVRSLELDVDVIAVMAGDGQMAPEDLRSVVDPIVQKDADYVKGNRLLRQEVVERMPRYRLVGNAFLTLITKFATGYWKSMDPQCGYTAISREALSTIPITTMTKGYGYNAHILNMLNLANFRVSDVEVEPVYRDEVSYIKLRKYVPMIVRLLTRLFFGRLIKKYFVRDFHPVVLMYLLSFLLMIFAIPTLSTLFVYRWIANGSVPTTSGLLLSMTGLFAFFWLFFAMWLDMEDNEHLWVRSRRRH